MVKLIHPQPPLVTQEPRRCWAASYASWQRANRAEFGVGAVGSYTNLIDWFENGTHLVTPHGRATRRGVLLMQSLGFMQIQRMPGQRVSASLILNKLQLGYIYCAFYWQGNTGPAGHAVVIYGIDKDRIYTMDPTPNQGYVQAPLITLKQRNIVSLGVSSLVGFTRSLDNTVARLG